MRDQPAPDAESSDGTPESEAQWQEFIEGLASGRAAAQELFWERYGKRLDVVARRHFPPGLNRRLAPEDIVQSTCRSFFMRIQDGRLEVSDRDSLWGLLCAIALNKTRMKQRFHLAQRRAINREQDVGAPSSDASDRPTLEPASATAPPDEAVIFAEQLERVMELLDATEKQILQLKLDNYTNQEIADRVNRSERTVRRVVERLQEKLAAALKSM
ncbi:MAG: RNA polymerase sigma factor [Aureliella sp.]